MSSQEVQPQQVEIVQPTLVDQSVSRRGCLIVGLVFLGGIASLREKQLGYLLDVRQQILDEYTPRNEKDSVYPYSAIAVLGGGYEKDSDGIFQPNEFQRMRLDAAARAYVDDQADLIILLNGQPEADTPEDVNLKYIQMRVNELSGGMRTLPSEKVIYENKTRNTLGNLEKLKEYVDEFELGEIIVFSNDFHLVRAAYLAKVIGIHAKFLAAEKVISYYEPQRISEFETLYDSDGMQARQFKEYVSLFLYFIDPSGTLATFLKPG